MTELDLAEKGQMKQSMDSELQSIAQENEQLKEEVQRLSGVEHDMLKLKEENVGLQIEFERIKQLQVS